MKWKKSDIDKDQVRALASRYNIDLLTAAILVRRGVTQPEEIKFYLEDDLLFMHNPFLFTEMEDAVDRILRAVDEGERVMIFGDRDVDGITSTVLLKEELDALGLECSWALPLGDDPYGLTKEAVDACYEGSCSLIITVDCGISNIEEISYAAERGIDTLVIDHHIPQEKLPPATVIIDPKMEDSGYPFRDLAGCGVVAKLIWALEFARTDIYKEEMVLLNARPGNDTVILEAVKLRNLVELDRITENLVPGMVRLEQSRLEAFLVGTQILVYGEQLHTRLLRKVFGEETDINLIDVEPKIAQVFPALEGKSLLKIREKSKSGNYAASAAGELDIFLNLFHSFMLRTYPALSREFEKRLDLVALGTLADLMPLLGENRILVRKGMAQLNKVEREGINELLLQQNLLGKRLSTTDVSWQISPVINATGRLGEPNKAAQMLLTDDPEERSKLVEEIISLNKRRKKQGENAWNSVLPRAEKRFRELGEQMVLVRDGSVGRGITGIIAARLVQYFGVPAAVIAEINGSLVGSMRSVKGFGLKEFLYRFEDLFLDYGGHDYAAGFSMTPDKYEEFAARFEREVQSLEPFEAGEELIEVDAELPSAYLEPSLHQLVERLEPYGEEHPPIIFLARRLRIAELSLVGKGTQQHVKMLLDSGRYKWPAIYWRAADKVDREFSMGDEVDVVFRLGRNYFKYTETSQLTILDVARR
jgi:single-stranded-DNA-specific exonuclease